MKNKEQQWKHYLMNKTVEIRDTRQRMRVKKDGKTSKSEVMAKIQ